MQNNIVELFAANTTAEMNFERLLTVAGLIKSRKALVKRLVQIRAPKCIVDGERKVVASLKAEYRELQDWANSDEAGDYLERSMRELFTGFLD